MCGYLSEDGCYSFEGAAITNVQTCSFARDSFDTCVAHDAAFGEALRVEMSAALEEFGRHMMTLGMYTSTAFAKFFLTVAREIRREPPDGV